MSAKNERIMKRIPQPDANSAGVELRNKFQSQQKPATHTLTPEEIELAIIEARNIVEMYGQQ